MVILDGIGQNDSQYGNAVKQADMECFNQLYEEYPHASLYGHGEYIGLPDNQCGNSEIGHLIFGAGKKIKFDVTTCNEVIGNPEIEENEKLVTFLNEIKERNGKLHLMGMVSDGGVHSDIKYMKNMIGHLSKMGIVKKMYFHVITDGKDTDDHVSKEYINDLESVMKSVKYGVIADVCGRYYAMDRDNKWERIKVYTDMIFRGKAAKVRSYERAIDACYKEGLTDEFLPPFIVNEDGIISDNDGIIWLNFRSDRSKQLLTAMVNTEFDEYNVHVPNDLSVLSLMEVPGIDNLNHLIDTEDLYSLGYYFSELGLSQARISETEKYSAVTLDFNGGKLFKVKGCDNFLIPSPNVISYDVQPQMNIEEVLKQVIKCLEKDYDFILVNLANADLVAHSGNFEATKASLKIIDDCLERIIEAVDDNFYHLIVTSSHSHCEEMLDKEGKILKKHSLNPVPFIIRDKKVTLRHKGDITQIAPTILRYMDIAIPSSMEGTKHLFIEED